MKRVAIGLAAALAAWTSAALAATPERDVLPADPQPVSYVIEIVPDSERLAFTGTAEIAFRAEAAISSVTMNARDLAIESAELVGQGPVAARVDAAAQRVAFQFARAVPAGTHTLRVAYRGKIQETASGLFRTRYGPEGAVKTMLATQMEPVDARSFAPMWDEPTAKARFTMSVVIPEALQAVSNMPPVATEPLPGGLKRIRFAPSPKMSSYLLYLGVGEFDRITETHAGIELGIVARRGAGEQGRLALADSKQIIDYYTDYFGVGYPLPKLDQIAVPGAGGFGAMENWGAILYFEKLLLLDPTVSSESDRREIFLVIAHEIAHQWFGNLVTMSWWDEIWLNEGFASWMESKAGARLHPEWGYDIVAVSSRERAMRLDARRSAHAIVREIRTSEEANLAFNPISYQKGEAVINMIEAYVGEAAFRDGVRAYMAKHAYSNTVSDDLWAAIAAETDAPVTDIARDFTLQPGVPLVVVESAACREGRTLIALRQDRFGVDAASKSPQSWRIPVIVGVVGHAPTRTALSGSALIEAEGCGPVLINAGQKGYYRTLYPAAERAKLAEAFAQLAPADQLGLLSDAYALGIAGYAPLSEFLSLADRVAPDSDPLVRDALAGQLTNLARLNQDRPSGPAFEAWARARLGSVFAQVGWQAAAGEAPSVPVLRATLIKALALLGDEPVIQEAKRRFAARDSDPSAAPPSIRAAVVAAFAMRADAAGLDTLRAAGAASANPIEAMLYKRAIATTLDP